MEKNQYERHIKYGHKEKRENKCHLCQKEFTSKCDSKSNALYIKAHLSIVGLYNLQYHLAHHFNARNFLCNECPRAYNTAADLGQHQRIHEKQRDPYRCEQCGLLFQIRSKFKTHMRTHQGATLKGPRECAICKKMFVCLSSHNRTVHLKLRTYECSECDKTFGKKSGLDRHTLTVHQKIKAYKCDVEGCFGAFGERSQLTKHLRTHLDKDVSYCSFCKENFDDIKGHFETEHEDITHWCKICLKKFSKPSSLKLHIKVFHTKERNYFCDYCPNKGFAERSQLKRHLRGHQEFISANDHIELKPEQIFIPLDMKLDFKAEADGLSELAAPLDVFVDIKTEILSDDELDIKREVEIAVGTGQHNVDRENLKDQYYQLPNNSYKICREATEIFLDHHSEQPVNGKEFSSCVEMEKRDCEQQKTTSGFACDKCGREFSKQDHLMAHFSAAHTDVKHDCPECNKSFGYKSALERHFKILHENLRDHICTKCGRSFCSKYDLSQHNEASHEGVHKSRRTCHICNKIFSKERNLKIHILAIHGDKSFECDICSKRFSFKSAKERHVKVVHLNQR